MTRGTSAAIHPVLKAPPALHQPCGHNETLRADYDERAGIAEFDGGLPRDEAEALASAEIVPASVGAAR